MAADADGRGDYDGCALRHVPVPVADYVALEHVWVMIFLGRPYRGYIQ